MKFLITSIMILAMLSASAEWVRGTVKMKNGELLTGYIKNLKTENEATVDFRRKQSDDVRKISSTSIAELQLRLSEGTLVAKYLNTSIINLSGEYRASKDKKWMRVIYRGEFDVMGYFTGDLMSDYYINWPGEENALMIYINEKNGAIANTKETLLRKSISTIFENRCDAMIRSVNEEIFVPNDIRDILRYYVDKCKKAEEIGFGVSEG
ncbi:MAG TPA: hypothetical protein VK212_03205 [Lentimicrobium sp.]|nr:hypothetical protein [Lentimicrobium sp.]